MPLNFIQEYRSRLTTAENAVKVVKSGDHVFYGEFVLFPRSLDAALANRIEELKNVEIRGVCFTQFPKVVEKDPLRKHVIASDYHFSGISRRLHDKNLCNYVPITYHQSPRFIRKYIEPDVAFITTAPMDKNGYLNYGLANSVTGANLSKAKKIIVEINENVPYCLGGNFESIHVSKVDFIVEGSNFPLIEVPPVPPKEVDRQIAGHILKEIEDGATLQLGIGGLPNLIGQLIAESDLKDIGIHTEMLVDSCVDLYESGRVTGRNKNIDHFKMAYTFAMGTKKLYDFLHLNPGCASYPVNYVNDPRIVALNPKVMAINNAVEVDLFSQVCSESSGYRQISGTGGQFDFIFGAFNSKGGKGIIALTSTYTDKDGTLKSRIVPTLQPGAIVTVPRSITHYVATEYGIAMLKGKSTWQRAEALINLAHPDLREELIREADKMHIWVKSNKYDA
ncbi:acetyl-CoA hydrolase/transferase family protein [Desulfobotulus sp.]|jgi:butyryl-CoA:acetate CoA-transferase|uniref:acetyl-CoA hydrolase/transferase family protein n=1 Tax=Desulfobotulus sp. TaxID=1940337 RepID=UPI002A36379A|nr:acetyl-CoA hydrolase/transferase C-terminal domain-containing protein [Desulfobotulus sp.]MDY0163055.1 acetyl-CoA hydrolase/transferase C-terminal domain-containing protein [Desulfobotulus sp.]